MPFPIKLTLDLSDCYLLVQEGEEGSPLSSSLFLLELEKNLKIITEAAQASIAAAVHRNVLQFHCSLLTFSAYVAQFPEGAEKRTDWQALPGGFSSESNFFMMKKLILFFQQEGVKRFPEIFTSQRSSGYKAIKRSLKTLSALYQIQQKDLPALSPVESRKRKRNESAKKTFTKKQRVERGDLDSMTSPTVLPLSQEQGSIGEKVPFGLIEEKEPVPLRSEAIDLFDPEVYLGGDSEEETESEARHPETIDRDSVAKLTLPLKKRPLKEDIEMAKLVKAQPLKRASRKAKSGKKIQKSSQADVFVEASSFILPLFCIEKMPYSHSPIFCFQYSTRMCCRHFTKRANSKYRYTLDNTCKNTRNNIKDILGLDNKFTLKWKEPFTLNETSEMNKKELLLKALQGLEATLSFLQKHSPSVLIAYPKTDPKKYLVESIELLKKTLSPLPSDFEQRVISENTKLTPEQVLTKLVQEKRVSIEIPSEKTTYYVYLFSIQKGGGVSKVNTFQLMYKRLEHKQRVVALFAVCRRSLQSSLNNLQALLHSPLDKITITDPFTGEIEKPTTQAQLYKILTEGLSENYLCLKDKIPNVLDSKGDKTLENELLTAIKKVKTQLEDSDISDEEDDDICDYISPHTPLIIPQLTQKISSSNLIPLERVVFKKPSEDIVFAPYIFSVERTKNVTSANQYRIIYAQKKLKTQIVTHIQARVAIMKTITNIQKLLTDACESVSFLNPFTKELQIVTASSELWPCILEGLLEMKLFYQGHFSNLLLGNKTSNPGQAIDDLVKRIKEEKVEFCKAPITESRILSKLMATDLEAELTFSDNEDK